MTGEIVAEGVVFHGHKVRVKQAVGVPVMEHGQIILEAVGIQRAPDLTVVHIIGHHRLHAAVRREGGDVKAVGQAGDIALRSHIDGAGAAVGILEGLKDLGHLIVGLGHIQALLLQPVLPDHHALVGAVLLIGGHELQDLPVREELLLLIPGGLHHVEIVRGILGVVAEIQNHVIRQSALVAGGIVHAAEDIRQGVGGNGQLHLLILGPVVQLRDLQVHARALLDLLNVAHLLEVLNAGAGLGQGAHQVRGLVHNGQGLSVRQGQLIGIGETQLRRVHTGKYHVKGVALRGFHRLLRLRFNFFGFFIRFRSRIHCRFVDLLGVLRRRNGGLRRFGLGRSSALSCAAAAGQGRDQQGHDT